MITFSWRACFRIQHRLKSLILGTILYALIQLSAIAAGHNSTSSPAVNTPTNAAPTITTHRPRIGLVLSGGGARGYAHLGVLEYLEQLHIPIDYIVGTSMGALIGGLYASGISANELETKLGQINLSDIAFDRNDRAQLQQTQRSDDFQYPLAITAGYGDGKLKTPSGLVQGNQLLALLQSWTSNLPGDIDFNHLPIPFQAIATDLGKGTKVVLNKGSLPRAMRASMAVPGLFSPIEIDHHILVDGGLVQNLPVQEARDMGADIIIAINIASPLQDPKTLQSPTAVAQQMIGILVQQNVTAQKALLHDQDILIEPELSHLTFTDFAHSKDGINAGWQAAQLHSARLLKLSLSPEQWQAYLAARPPAEQLAKGLRIDDIDIHVSGNIPPSFVRNQINVHEGDLYDSSAINKKLTKLPANAYLNNVSQELIKKDGRNVLVVNADERTWGPQFLLFGLGIANNFNGRGSYNLQLGHRYPWINQTGLSWHNDVLLGNKEAQIRTELRQPLYNPAGIYIAPYFEIQRNYYDLYPNSNDVRAIPLTQYRVNTTIAGVDLGIPLSHLGELRVGLNYQRQNYSAMYFEPHAEQITPTYIDIQQPRLHALLTIDQLDDPLFPQKGYYLTAEANRGFGGVDSRYSDAQVKTLWAFSYGRHTINLALRAASNFGSTNVGDSGSIFSLGGFQQLSAYAPDQFYGPYLLYGRVTYLKQLTDINFPGLRNPVFGTSLELGNVWQTRHDFGSGSYKKSASVFVGGSSLVGPLYLGIAVGSQNVWNLYLQMGRVF